LEQASGAAVSTILKILLDKDAPVSSRLRTAESVVVHAAKAIEIEQIEARSRSWSVSPKHPARGRFRCAG
jgi:hypothetical protein